MNRAVKFIIQIITVLLAVVLTASALSRVLSLIAEHLTVQSIYAVMTVAIMILIRKGKRI